MVCKFGFSIKVRNVGIEAMIVEMLQSVFDVSSGDEQKEILIDFGERFPLSSVTAHDFQQNRWTSLMNWSAICECWAEVRALPCPSFDEFSTQRAIKEMGIMVRNLEAS